MVISVAPKFWLAFKPLTLMINRPLKSPLTALAVNLPSVFPSAYLNKKVKVGLASAFLLLEAVRSSISKVTYSPATVLTFVVEKKVLAASIGFSISASLSP